MRTFFLLNEDRVKIGIVPAKSVQWNRCLYQPGTFTVEIPASSFTSDIKYVFKDRSNELGLVQKYEYRYTLSEGKVVVLSGAFIEVLLYNIPLTMFNPLRQLDSFDGVILYNSDDPPPKNFSRKLRKENQVVYFSSVDATNVHRVKEACYCVTQLAQHEYNKYIDEYNLPVNTFAFDELASNPITAETFSHIDEADEQGVYTEPDIDGPDFPDTGYDDLGRAYFLIKKGDTVYLGDTLYNWLNGYWCKNTETEYNIPPWHPYLRCAFDITTGKITFGVIDTTTIIRAYEFNEEAGNILSMNYSQDISQEPAAGLCRAVYLKDATQSDTPDNYEVVEALSLRNRFDDYHDLPLKATKSGKLDIKTEYLGNVFSDYVTREDCVTSVKNSLANFNNYNSTMTFNLEPFHPDVDDYQTLYDLGNMIKVNGEYKRIVEIKESIKDGVEQLTLTFESSEKTPFTCFIDKTESLFKNNRWKAVN